jgi:hypothetical protein
MQHEAVKKLNHILRIGFVRPIPSQIENIQIIQEHVNIDQNAGNACHCECQHNKPHLHTQKDKHTVNCYHLIRPDPQV